jgi:hypothetical protein
LDALNTWLQDRLNTMIEKYMEMQGVTQDMVNGLQALLDGLFGPNGTAAVSFNNFSLMIDNAVLRAQQRTAELAAMLTQINQMSASVLGGTQLQTNPVNPATFGATPQGANYGLNYNPNATPHNTGYWNYPGYANGVQNMLLTKPRLFMAGEVPEVMSITPVSQLNNKGNGRMGGSATLRVALSEGLIAEIIDNTLDNVAEVIIER